jgi:hypothetical protein
MASAFAARSCGRRNGRTLGFLLACFLVAAPARPEEPATSREPLVVPPAARKVGDLVALGRAVEVAGRVGGSVVATAGSVYVTGNIAGHVVVFGGDVTIAGDGRVDGDVLTVGGSVRFEGGATAARSVAGHVRSLDALEAAFLTELRTSPVARASVSPLLFSFRIFLLFLWLFAGLTFVRLVPRRLAATAALAPGRLILLGALGTSAVLTGLLFSAGLLLVLPAKAGIALAAIVVALLYVAKLWGLSAAFLALGRLIFRNAQRGSAFFGDPSALTAGLLSLGLVSLFPLAGPLVWAVASVVGIGLTLESLSGCARERALASFFSRAA